jgi:hypothetical protein
VEAHHARLASLVQARHVYGESNPLYLNLCHRPPQPSQDPSGQIQSLPSNNALMSAEQLSPLHPMSSPVQQVPPCVLEPVVGACDYLAGVGTPVCADFNAHTGVCRLECSWMQLPCCLQ